MTQKIFIHIGAHKSASTTLQVNLEGYKNELLKNHNILYIGPAEISISPIGEHFRNLSKGKLSDKAQFNESINRCVSHYKKELSHHEKILLSWEGFLGHSSLNLYGGIYTHSKKVSESLNAIFDNKISSILLIIRNQNDFIESCYLQQIKECKTLSFHDFTNNINIKKISWFNVVNSFHQSKTKVVPFELINEVGTKRFIELCLSHLIQNKVTFDTPITNNHYNPSFSDLGVKLSHELLPLIPPEKRKTFNKILFNQFSNIDYPKASLFSEMTKNLIKSVCKEDNRLIFHTYKVDTFLQEENLVKELKAITQKYYE